MPRNTRENTTNNPERLDKIKALGTKTRADIAEVSMSLSEISRMLGVLVDLELPANATRVVAKISIELGKAQIANQMACHRLEKGRVE